MNKQSTPPDPTRALLVHYVRGRGAETTIADLLADPVVGALVPDLTIADLGGDAQAIAGVARRGRPPTIADVANAPPRGRPAAHAGRTNGASASAHAETSDYDDRVLAIITASDSPVSANDVMKETGGTPVQFRAAVDRLRAGKKIKREGKARGTKYRAA